MWKGKRFISSLFLIACISLVLGSMGCVSQQMHWYKGNTHCHSWWSDGSSPPEIPTAWYKDHGYNFLCISDHNVLKDHEKWYTCKKPAIEKEAAKYEKQYGDDWIEKRVVNGKTEYKLKQLHELKKRYEEPGRFLLIPGKEFGAKCEKRTLHINAINVTELVPSQSGDTPSDIIQNNIAAAKAQEAKYGQPVLVHINHPNFGKGLTAEDMYPVQDLQFIEVYNGHSGVKNYGFKIRPSVERLWDIILTKRLGDLNLPITYGIATDDAHNYINYSVGHANPGRGWIMVRARKLDASDLIKALKRGDFYASTGVVLKDIEFKDNILTIEIQPREGVTYQTQFIGTCIGYNPTTRPATHAADKIATAIYSDDIGKVLSEQAGTRARYKLTGRELYVRAKVISSAVHPNPFAKGDMEVAWVQPVRPSSGR